MKRKLKKVKRINVFVWDSIGSGYGKDVSYINNGGRKGQCLWRFENEVVDVRNYKNNLINGIRITIDF